MNNHSNQQTNNSTNQQIIIPSGMNRSVEDRTCRTGCIPYGMHPKDCNIFSTDVVLLQNKVKMRFYLPLLIC